MNPNPVIACSVVSTKDLNLRPQHDIAEIVSRFLTFGEGVVAHWVEFARGVLLFVMAPGDDHSGEFYIYDRTRGQFWLLELADGVFGGYAVSQKLSVEVKGSGNTEGIELFPKQDRVPDGQFGNAIRGPLGVHRAAGKRYWFYGAAYDLSAQMEYLRSLRRVSEAQLADLVAGVPAKTVPEPVHVGPPPTDRPYFQILDHLEVRRRVGRNWVTQCPSCAAAGHDRSQDNLAISVEEPWKYRCWAGCTKEQIRAALGASKAVTRRSCGCSEC